MVLKNKDNFPFPFGFDGSLQYQILIICERMGVA
jgi:hypothetical protein